MPLNDTVVFFTVTFIADITQSLVIYNSGVLLAGFIMFLKEIYYIYIFLQADFITDSIGLVAAG